MFDVSTDEGFLDWLSCAGVMLACGFGTKWVGLFVIVFLGLSTALDLWDLIGDLTIPVVCDGGCG